MSCKSQVGAAAERGGAGAGGRGGEAPLRPAGNSYDKRAARVFGRRQGGRTAGHAAACGAGAAAVPGTLHSRHGAAAGAGRGRELGASGGAAGGWPGPAAPRAGRPSGKNRCGGSLRRQLTAAPLVIHAVRQPRPVWYVLRRQSRSAATGWATGRRAGGCGPLAQRRGECCAAGGQSAAAAPRGLLHHRRLLHPIQAGSGCAAHPRWPASLASRHACPTLRQESGSRRALRPPF